MIDDVTPPERLRQRKPKRIEPPERPMGQPLHEQAKAIDPTLKTPEEIAEEEPVKLEPTVIHEANDLTPRKRWWAPPYNRTQTIIGSIIIVLLVAGLGAGWTLTHRRPIVAETPKKSIVKKEVPKPIIYSTLTGLPVADDSVNQRPVTAVMIENSLDARPQSGLGEAGVVFEAVAEGGVTRFLALFQDTAPSNIGPIRSARPYYIQWALGFDAAYGHVGGSPDALNDIKTWGVKDMNQFYNGNSYHRVSSRAAPHNVYTSIATLNQLEASKSFTSSYTGFSRSTKASPSTQPNATSIDMKLSGPLYNPHYDYDATINSYKRSEGGSAHTDANTNQQIAPKVVISLVVPLSRGALDSSGAYYSNYNVLGTGTAYIFQNGTVTTGRWTKASNTAQLTFTDDAGNAIPLNPGQTWITAVSATNQVSYK